MYTKEFKTAQNEMRGSEVARKWDKYLRLRHISTMLQSYKLLLTADIKAPLNGAKGLQLYTVELA